MNSIEWQSEVYPMDFYSADSLGPWTPNFKATTPVKIEEKCLPKEDCNDCQCETR
jgi:hypothetical protein